MSKLARETGVDTKVRTFSAWSHVVAMLYAQLTHAIGLNDVCDALRHHCGWLAGSHSRGDPAKSQRTVAAGKHRDSARAEKLFWGVLAHLQNLLSAALWRRTKGARADASFQAPDAAGASTFEDAECDLHAAHLGLEFEPELPEAFVGYFFGQRGALCEG